MKSILHQLLEKRNQQEDLLSRAQELLTESQELVNKLERFLLEPRLIADE